MEFGQRLRDERLKQGLSLDEIEEETKIRKYYIEALEREDFRALPPPVYASGFVKRYAVMLGLDEQDMVREFKERAYGPEEEPEPEQIVEPLPVKEKKPLPVKNIIAGLVFLGLVLWLGSYPASCIARRGQEKVTPTQPQVGQKQNTNSPTQTPVKPAIQTAGLKVKVDAVQRSWLSVTVDGKNVYTGTMAVGDSKTFEGTSNVHIHTGNAGGIKLSLNGQEVPALGKVGEIKDQDFKAGQ
ncbi:MAG TPA: RodZ domain-containing protein [Syntrophomonadaceae bacterium]|nr:RodZ domain-containing protein [Syntrophomonadaceae bacterium]